MARAVPHGHEKYVYIISWGRMLIKTLGLQVCIYG